MTIAKLLIAAGAAMLLLAVVLAFAEPTSQTPVSKDTNTDLVRSEREAIKSFEHTATVVAPLMSLGILCLVGAGGLALVGRSRKLSRKAEDK